MAIKRRLLWMPVCPLRRCKAKSGPASIFNRMKHIWRNSALMSDNGLPILGILQSENGRFYNIVYREKQHACLVWCRWKQVRTTKLVDRKIILIGSQKKSSHVVDLEDKLLSACILLGYGSVLEGTEVCCRLGFRLRTCVAGNGKMDSHKISMSSRLQWSILAISSVRECRLV